MNKLFRCSLVGFLFTTGCVEYKVAGPYRQRKPLPDIYRKECEYPKQVLPVKITPCGGVKGRYTVDLVELTVPVAGDSCSTKPLVLERYMPTDTNGVPLECVPTIIESPISSHEYLLDRSLARYYVAYGYAFFIIHHDVETVPRELRRHPDYAPENPRRIGVLFWQSAIDVVRALDWMETCPELDHDRVVYLGISRGALKGVGAIAIDPRIKAAVFVLGGEDIGGIITRSCQAGIQRKRELYMLLSGTNLKEYRRALRREMLWDPKCLAPSVESAKVRLYLAVFDRTVPFEKGWELRHDLGDPETVVLLSGHYTAAFYILYIRADALDFFNKKLGIEKCHRTRYH